MVTSLYSVVFLIFVEGGLGFPVKVGGRGDSSKTVYLPKKI